MFVFVDNRKSIPHFYVFCSFSNQMTAFERNVRLQTSNGYIGIPLAGLTSK